MERWGRLKYQPNLPLETGKEKVTESPAHRNLSREAAKEGMVLLKNEGCTLPLEKGSRIVLLGKGTFDYVKGGGGSGSFCGYGSSFIQPFFRKWRCSARWRKAELPWMNETVSIPQLSWGNNRCKWR